MTRETINKLLDAVDAKRKSAEYNAQSKAMDYVQSMKQEDRDASKIYLRDAELWREARQMIVLHTANVS